MTFTTHHSDSFQSAPTAATRQNSLRLAAAAMCDFRTAQRALEQGAYAVRAGTTRERILGAARELGFVIRTDAPPLADRAAAPGVTK